MCMLGIWITGVTDKKKKKGSVTEISRASEGECLCHWPRCWTNTVNSRLLSLSSCWLLTVDSHTWKQHNSSLSVVLYIQLNQQTPTIDDLQPEIQPCQECWICSDHQWLKKCIKAIWLDNVFLDWGSNMVLLDFFLLSMGVIYKFAWELRCILDTNLNFKTLFSEPNTISDAFIECPYH